MKNIKTTIICDSCEKDISPIDTQYPHDYILRLSSYDRAYNTSGISYAVIRYAPIENDLYFCGLQCLKNWIGDLK